MNQLGLPEPQPEPPSSQVPRPVPRYGEDQGRLTLNQLQQLEELGSPPEQFDYLHVFFIVHFYQEHPLFLIDDIPNAAIVQFLAEELGEHRPYELVATYGYDALRIYLRGCLEVYDCYDWRSVGIRNPAAFFRYVLREGIVPGAQRAPAALQSGRFTDQEEQNRMRRSTSLF